MALTNSSSDTKLSPKHRRLRARSPTPFHCDLCNKGYSRMNDYEAHLSSYDHSHKQRMRDMKAMTRDPGATDRARKAEAKADGLVSIKMDTVEKPAASGGFKKGGFKKSGFKSAFGAKEEDSKAVEKETTKPQMLGAELGLVESDTEDEGYEVYDPRFPTD